jgi:hypothetical protein
LPRRGRSSHDNKLDELRDTATNASLTSGQTVVCIAGRPRPEPTIWVRRWQHAVRLAWPETHHSRESGNDERISKHGFRMGTSLAVCQKQ